MYGQMNLIATFCNFANLPQQRHYFSFFFFFGTSNLSIQYPNFYQIIHKSILNFYANRNVTYSVTLSVSHKSLVYEFFQTKELSTLIHGHDIPR